MKIVDPVDMPRRRAWALEILGSAITVVGTFTPWLYSGTRGYSAYRLAMTAQRLDLTGVKTLATPIAFLPLVLALAFLARWGAPRWLRSALIAVSASYVAVAALVARAQPLPAGPGIAISIFGAALLALSVAYELRWGSNAGGNPR